MLRAVFPWRNSVPDILFYDNNCHLRRHVHATPNDPLQHMGQPVDIFHFKSKHKESNDYCGQHCNAMLFEDLYDAETKTWHFNSSVAEQTNVWINGYHAIVHDMEATCYDFFLDEMIKERNCFWVDNLEQQGHNPHLLPEAWLHSNA
jgi:hypothetical protein